MAMEEKEGKGVGIPKGLNRIRTRRIAGDESPPPQSDRGGGGARAPARAGKIDGNGKSWIGDWRGKLFPLDSSRIFSFSGCYVYEASEMLIVV